MSAVAIPRESELMVTVGDMVTSANEVVIMTAEDYSAAVDLLAAIKTRCNEIERERKAIVQPINNSVTNINNRFGHILAPLYAVEQEIKDKMLAFRKVETDLADQMRAEVEQKAKEEAAANSGYKPEPLPARALPPPSKVYGQTGATSSVKQTWDYEVTDILALATARPDLVMVDSAAVQKEIRGKGGEIPGLRIFQKPTISIRS